MGITNEEAWNRIDSIIAKHEIDDENVTIINEKDYDALRMARKILESQPCEDWYDVPSDEMTLEQARQAVKDLRKKLAEYLEQQHCEDCISREAVKEMLSDEWTKYMPMKLDINLSFVMEKINELPSVTPKGVTITDFADRCRECGKQKVGKWIDTGIGKDELYGEMFVCSECNSVSYYENFCPNCGADMRECEEKG